MTQTSLLVGATGMFGRRISHDLLEQPDTRVRLLVRDVESKKDVFGPLAAADAELIVGDLADPASCTPAGLEPAVIENAMPAPERIIPPSGATPPPNLSSEQYRSYGMDNAPGPNPIAPNTQEGKPS